MDVEDEATEESEIEEVTLAEGACTVDTKAIAEQSTAHDLEFGSEFTVNTEEHVTTITELENSALKRKHEEDAHIEGPITKSAHLDLQPSDEYDAVNSLVTIATPVAIATSQEGSLSQSCQGCQADLTITNALAAITGQASHEPTLLPSTPAPEVPQDRVNQAWFTTKEDKDSLQGKGMKWRQGMWSKEENELLNCNILEYCKMNNISDPNVIIFSMTKDERKDFYRTIAQGIKRPLFAIYRRVLRMYDRKNYIGKYSSEEVEQLKALKEKHGNDWATIGHAMGRSASSVKDRYRLLRETCQSGKWTTEEEERLSHAVHAVSSTEQGESVTGGVSWSVVAEKVGTRSEKQCRSKWLNYLNWKEKGGKEWTKKDEITLINRIYDLNLDDENIINWTSLMDNWTSVRSPQWLRSKWWALKKHCPLVMSFREQVEYLRSNWIDTLQSKLERQETRFKGGRSSHNYISTPRQPPHSTGIPSSTIAQTITVNSDGSITREDDSAQGRFEVVAVNAIAADGTYHTTTSQGQPSYIIHSVQPTSLAPGHTYIIQQPTLEMMRQSGQMETIEGQNEQVQISSQGVVMTATVLHPHHAVRTLSPELAQAIVQTDISGPITSSDLEATHHLTQTDIQSPSDEQPLPTHTIHDSLSDSVGINLQQAGQTDIQSPVNQEMDATTSIMDPAEVVRAVPQAPMGVVEVTDTSIRDHVIQKADDEQHNSEPYQPVGPAAIAQSLDGTELSVSTVTQMSSQISLSQPIEVTQLSGTLGQSFSTLVSRFATEVPTSAAGEISQAEQNGLNEAGMTTGDKIVLQEEGGVTTVGADNEETIVADDEPSPHSLHAVDDHTMECAASEVVHHALQQSDTNDLSASDVTPQAVLPEQFLQSHVDDPADISLPSTASVEISVPTQSTAAPPLQSDLGSTEVSSHVLPVSNFAMATTVVSVTTTSHVTTE